MRVSGSLKFMDSARMIEHSVNLSLPASSFPADIRYSPTIFTECLHGNFRIKLGLGRFDFHLLHKLRLRALVNREFMKRGLPLFIVRPLYDKEAKEVTGHSNLAKIQGMECVFCERISLGDMVLQTDFAVAFLDKFPVSPGHMLILPRRHETDFFRLPEEEQKEIWGLIDLTRKHLEKKYSPDGYNIGINAGKAAGQTVAHAHLHIIPRYLGDVDDPRGGIRWVLPLQAPYWERE